MSETNGQMWERFGIDMSTGRPRIKTPAPPAPRLTAPVESAPAREPIWPITITLPWPPSTNSIWRNVDGQTLLSKKGRTYRRKCRDLCVVAGIAGLKYAGRLRARIVLQPPNKQRRDVDNHCKAILDALTHAGVWIDDEQIDDMHVLRGDIVSSGYAIVTIQPIL